MDKGRQLHAIGYMLAAVLMFCLMDAGLKILSAHYPTFQVSAIRGTASLPLVLVWALWTGGARSLLRVRWPLHLLRGVLGIVMMAGFVYSLRTLPLSTAYSIFFVAPLMITALSVPFLGERVGPRRWVAIAVGLVGVLVVLRPTGEGVLSLAGVAVLLAAFGYSVSAITVRIIARTDSTQALMVWLLFFMALGAGVLAAPHGCRSAARMRGHRWHRRRRRARPVRDHRSLPPRRGIVGRAARIHRAAVGRAARCHVVGRAAGFGHLDRCGDHRRQRPLLAPPRTRARGSRAPLERGGCVTDASFIFGLRIVGD